MSKNKNNARLKTRKTEEDYGAMLHDLTLIAARPSAFATPTRRQLLGTTAIVALTAGLLTTTLSRYAVAAATFDDTQKMMLLRVARDIYPHETLLDNAPYQAVIDSILTEAGKDEKVAKMMADGLADLDKRSGAIYKSKYVDVKNPLEREGLLRQIELTDWFQKIRGGLLFGLYNNKALYPKFGYDGSSWEHGGWIKDPSFGKVDWLGL
ncbi:MAG TPA: gluconate 2-dehydrogenase subunit 3 family protein [Hyphomicrobium sp.]|nr:gluconate 2-dehydrogenase subunit 3 family protein [Hyphomicrobium sp.]